MRVWVGCSFLLSGSLLLCVCSVPGEYNARETFETASKDINKNLSNVQGPAFGSVVKLLLGVPASRITAPRPNPRSTSDGRVLLMSTPGTVVIAQMPGSLPLLRDTLVEFQAPAFGLAQPSGLSIAGL